MIIKMETIKRNTIAKMQKRKKETKSQVLEDILEEYCLKRNSFNPAHPSPNLFIGKLEFRMKQYYNNLYKTTNRFTE